MPGRSRVYVAGSVPVIAACWATVLAGSTSFSHVAVVVVNAPGPLLLLGDRCVEVVVEVAALRRRPGEGPPHPPLVGLEGGDRGPGDGDHRDVVVLEVDHRSVEAVGDRRARGAAGGEVRPEHEVVDEQLRAPAEEVGERGGAFRRVEAGV